MPYFTGSDGTQLAYEDHGTGRPLVLLAGWTLAADMWEYQVPFLVEAGYRCVLLDRRGHGRSDSPSGGYDLDTLADDVAALVEHLDLRDVTLVGHSNGAGECVRYLARHGEERVAAVAFVCGTGPYQEQTEDNPDGLPEALVEAAIAAFRRDRPKFFADRAQGYYATHLFNDVSPALIELGVRQCLLANPVAAVEFWRAAYHADHRADLRAITVPALVVHGAADQSADVARTGRRTAALVPGAVYREYPTAGHGLYVTHRDQLNADLIELVERSGVRAGAAAGTG
jgi:non-heme chloroperoxidase